jgi:hypothetical protein
VNESEAGMLPPSVGAGRQLWVRFVIFDPLGINFRLKNGKLGSFCNFVIKVKQGRLTHFGFDLGEFDTKVGAEWVNFGKKWLKMALNGLLLCCLQNDFMFYMSFSYKHIWLFFIF